jgi:class 3 adenylate cyclase
MEESRLPRETERRRVTVMFADITGFTSLTERSDTEQAYEAVTGCLKLLDGIARKHGGSVDKYLGDCIMAVFGLPLALEEAPKAAVNAAIEMLRRVHDYSREAGIDPPLDVHIGINTGLAISGDVSGPILREFAVMGDPVNIAARLKDLAPPGRVYVGPETQRYTAGEFEYRPLQALSLKGKSEKVPSYELLSQRERLYRARGERSHSIFSALVGREEAWQALQGELAALREGRGGIAAVVADAGLGKTRLIDELQRSLEGEDIGWQEGRAVPIGRNLAYHTIADLLRNWAGITEDDEDKSARGKLEAAVEGFPEAEAVVPVLASITGLKLGADDRRRLRQTPGDAMDHVIVRTITEILRSAARRRPFVLFFEDLHWADAASIQLLETVARLAGELPILVLFAARPGFPETSGRLLRFLEESQGQRLRRVELTPLGRGDARKLLRNLVGQGDVPSEFLARVEAKAGGNPFFLEEVVRALLASGALRKGERGLHATESLPQVAIPDTVHEVIMSRVDRLPPETRQVLQAAAVIGRTIHRAVMLAVIPEEIDLIDRLVDLERLEMLERRDRAGSEFGFRHPLIQEVAYDSILRATREKLHRDVARAIEDHLPDSVPGFYGMLAFHFGLGKDAESAEEYLFKAGDEATRLGAAEEALHFFEEAAARYIELHGEGGDPRKKALLERNIALAHSNRGEQGQAVDHINRALVHLGERIPRGRTALGAEAARGVLSVVAELYLSRGRGGRPPADPDRRAVIELMFDRARAQATTAPVRFVFDAFSTFRKLRAVDPRSVERSGGMYAGMVGPLSFSGLSFSFARRFLALAEPLVRSEDVAERFLFELMRFVHGHLAGEWEDGCEIERGAVDETLRLGVIWDVTNYLGLLAERRLMQGRFADARALIAELEKIAELYQYDLARSTHRGLEAFLKLEEGRAAQALRAADLYYTEHQEPMFNLLALGAKAKAELLLGELAAAAETLGRGEMILADAGIMPPYHASSLWRSRLLFDLRELEGARAQGERRLARRAAKAARASAKQALAAVAKAALRRPEVWRLEGRRRWLAGDRKGGLAWLRRSLLEAERLGMAPERARTLAELAARLADPDSPARELEGRDALQCLSEAESAFSKLEIDFDLGEPRP